MNKEACDLLLQKCLEKDDKDEYEVELKRLEELGEFCRELLVLSQEVAGKKSLAYRMPYNAVKIVEESVDLLLCSIHKYTIETKEKFYFTEAKFEYIEDKFSDPNILLLLCKSFLRELKNKQTKKSLEEAQLVVGFIAQDLYWFTIHSKLSKWHSKLNYV